MKVGKIYLEWVKYLKEKGLYVKFMCDYAYANELINFRNILIREGKYWDSSVNSKLKDFNHRFFNCRDFILTDKGNSMTFEQLRLGMSNLSYSIPSTIRRAEWGDLVLEFGEERGYYKKPQPRPLGENYWGLLDDEDYFEYSVQSATTRTQPTRVRHRNENAGQWYDVYYRGGRNINNRINNRYNNRWRR
jgi:hypothetical protein